MTGLPRIINILLAVAIVSVLVYMFSNVVEGAAQRTQQSSCVSNLHQLSLAVRMYAGDNDEILPPYPTRKQDAWPQVLRHYALHNKDKQHQDPDLIEVSTVKPYICPSRTEKGYGYGFNFYLIGSLVDTPGDSTKIILLAEGSGVTDEEWWVNDVALTESLYRYQPRQEHLPQLSVHPGGGNLAFLDGHVQVAKPDQLSSENWLPY